MTTEMVDYAQAMITAAGIVEGCERIARGDGYCPTTAEERAAAAAEAAEWEAKRLDAAQRLTACAWVAVSDAAEAGDLDDLIAAQSEQVAEILGEQAQFGDSGPGTAAVVEVARAIEVAARRRARIYAGQSPFSGGTR